MADVNVGMELGFSQMSPSASDKEKIDYLLKSQTQLIDAYVRMKRDLENALQTIDSSNVTEIDAERVRVTNLTAGTIKTGELVVGGAVGQGTARRNFTAQPTTPYSIGDTWTAGSTGDFKVCTTARATGAYTAGDWVLSTKYTDDSNTTTIIGNTVTTGFVNALSVVAGSVAAENISGTYITGKTVRTAVTNNARMEMKSDGIITYNSSNQKAGISIEAGAYSYGSLSFYHGGTLVGYMSYDTLGTLSIGPAGGAVLSIAGYSTTSHTHSGYVSATGNVGFYNTSAVAQQTATNLADPTSQSYTADSTYSTNEVDMLNALKADLLAHKIKINGLMGKFNTYGLLSVT